MVDKRNIEEELREYFKKPIRIPRRNYLYKIVIWFIDFFLFTLSSYLAFHLRFYLADIINYLNIGSISITYLEFPINVQIYINLTIIFSSLLSLSFIHFHLYETRRYSSRIDDTFNIAKAVSVGTVLTLGITFLLKWYLLSRFVIISIGIIVFILLSIWRVLLKSISILFWRIGIGTEKIFIYGAGEAGRLLLSQYRLHTPFGGSVIGFIDDDQKKAGKKIDKLPVLGGLEDLSKITQKYNVTTMILAIPSVSNQRMLEIIFYLKKHNINFRIMPNVLDIITHRVSTENVGSITLFRLIDQPLTQPWRLVKRAIDIILSLILLIILLPIFIIIGILIKLTSKGSILFNQERVGEKGKRFIIYKFRTMYTGSESIHEKLRPESKHDGPLLVLPDDPRQTPIGRFLRRISLDELPQLINVIKGDMSLVGPRPLMPSEITEYKNWHLKRLSVPQGMTGLWQVSGRAAIPFDQMVKLDIYYVENWSLLLDLKIFLLTIPSVVSMRGAY
jgi:exopolysaccharide biosynthesis polyprenyl glycosylphosphotransferase